MSRKVGTAVLAGLLVVFLASSTWAVVVDGIAVVVNKDAVLVSEINETLMPLMQEYKSKYSGAELQKQLANLRETIINQAIESKLILQAAKEKGLVANEKEVDARLELVKSRFPSEDDFLKVLAAKGVTLSEYRQQVADQVLVQQAVQSMLNPDIQVLDNEIREYYDSHKEDFVTEAEVKLAQIFLAVPSGASPDAVEAIRQKAEQLHVLLEDGMDFGEIASHYTEGPKGEKGGFIGVVGKNEILPELEEVAFKLKAGEISPVIRTAFGFHILKAIDVMPAKKFTFEEAKPKIEEHLREAKRSEKYKEWIQQLRDKAYIDVKL